MEAMRAFRLREDDLAPALLFVALAALACLTPAQNDTWWHLRSGQAMWQSRGFLTTEPFSFTAFGTPLQNHWWLSQLVFFAVFSAGGPVLLTLFAGACALIAVYGSWRLLRGPLEVRVVLLAFLAVATAPEWSVRPQVISLALLVLCAHLIVRDRLLWLPAVCVLWGNAHAMVVFGVLMAGACALEALVWSRRRLVRDAAVTLGCVLAPMLSPIGWEYWPRVLATVGASKSLQLQEYMPPLDAASLPFWCAVVLLLVLTARGWHSLAARPREDRILLLASFALAAAAATASRNVAFFAVIAAPAGSRLWPASARVHRQRAAPWIAYALVVVALLAAAVAVVARWRDGGTRIGWKPISSEVIRAVGQCPEPMFNSLEDGGYLMWSLPARQVFIDSRMEAYPLELLQRSRAADLWGEYAALFDDYDIRCALVETGSRLHERLLQDDAMQPVFSDASRTLFVRRAR
jgi:hypothetical protein